MTQDKLKNPPAFPCKAIEHKVGEVGNNVATYYEAEGMTLRDYFAAAAMQGMLASAQAHIENDAYTNARYAYDMADGMLKARGE
jgi:hypothetical protein